VEYANQNPEQPDVQYPVRCTDGIDFRIVLTEQACLMPLMQGCLNTGVEENKQPPYARLL
jgi:hypothetical protein